MDIDAHVALLNQMEADTVARVGCEIETEVGVVVREVDASHAVPLVLSHLTVRSEQVEVAPHVTLVGEIRLEWFVGYLSSVHVHGAAQQQSFRQGAEEQVLVRVRPGSMRDE